MYALPYTPGFVSTMSGLFKNELPTMDYCLIVHDHKEQSNTLANWLVTKGFQIHETTDLEVVQEYVKLYSYAWVWIHVKRWDFELLAFFPSEQRFILLSKFKERFTDSLDRQIPSHLKEPFTGLKIDRLLDRLQTTTEYLNADCLIVKSNWEYKQIYLKDIEFVKRSKAQYFSWIKTSHELLPISGTFNYWTKQLCRGQLFKRKKDTLIVPNQVYTKLDEEAMISTS